MQPSELWTIQQPQWKFPVHVAYVTQPGILRISPATDHTGKFFNETFLPFINALGGQFLHGKIWVPEDAFKKHAKLEGPLTDPATLVQNPPAQQAAEPPPPSGLIGLDPGEDEFLRSFWQKCAPMSSFQDLAIVWKQLTTFAMDWMINKERPLDLGFLTLHSVPYRANWKGIMSEAHPGLALALRYKGKNAQLEYMTDTQAGADLHHPYLLAYEPKRGIVYWTVEVCPKKLWYKNTIAREVKRKQMKGAAQYAKSIQTTISRLLESHTQILSSWLAQISRPCAVYGDGHVFGSYVLLPYIPKKGIRPAAAKAGHTPPVLPRHVLPPTAPLATPHESMPQVPTLQPDK